MDTQECVFPGKRRDLLDYVRLLELEKLSSGPFWLYLRTLVLHYRLHSSLVVSVRAVVSLDLGHTSDSYFREPGSHYLAI